MKKIEKRPLTLFELLIVMLILSFVGGAVAIGFKNATTEQNFKTEVSKVVDSLRLAQELMSVIPGEKVHLIFKEERDGNYFFIELDTPLEEGSLKKQISKHQRLKTIKGVFFKDTLNYPTTKGTIDIKFYSKGMVMSQAILRLASSSEENPPSNTLQVYIPLVGFPRPIEVFDSKEKADEVYNNYRDKRSDDTLTIDTFTRLPQKNSGKK